MNATEIMATYEAKKAKKVFLYRNGSDLMQPKCLVVNERHIRDFSTFLTRVTSGIRAPVAVRNIYTPREGHRVSKLEQLESGNFYVAGGTEHFRKLKYGKEEKKKQNQLETLSHTRSRAVIKTPSRYLIPTEKPVVIHVFRNGDEKYRGARILLSRKITCSWEHVLELITEKVNLITPAKRLCTLDGRLIHAVSEIQDGGKYVALQGSKPFVKVAYCSSSEKKMLKTSSRAGGHLTRKPEHYKFSLENEKTPKSPRVKRQRKGRPMAGRKNKEGREKAVKDHREDSIFGGSPANFDESTRAAGMPSPPLKESRKETELQQGEEQDTSEAVEEKIAAEEEEAYVDTGAAAQRQSKDIHMESHPTQISIDLSATRIKASSPKQSVDAQAVKGSPRQSIDAKGSPRQSIDAKGSPRQSIDAKAGPRQSINAKGSPRQSIDAKAGPRQSINAKGSPRQSIDAKAVKGSPRQSIDAKAVKGSPRQSIDAKAVKGSPRQSIDAKAVKGSPRQSIDAQAVKADSPRQSTDAQAEVAAEVESDAREGETVTAEEIAETTADQETAETTADQEIAETKETAETTADQETAETTADQETAETNETAETTADQETAETTADQETAETKETAETMADQETAETAETTADQETAETTADQETAETKETTEITGATNEDAKTEEKVEEGEQEDQSPPAETTDQN